MRRQCKASTINIYIELRFAYNNSESHVTITISYCSNKKHIVIIQHIPTMHNELYDCNPTNYHIMHNAHTKFQ